MILSFTIEYLKGSWNMLNKNIVLIGMPGSGKTSIGQILANKMDREFWDIDQYIEKLQDKNISEIFESGERKFRKIEMETVKTISEKQGIVISTGGGVVKFPENIYHLKKNGIIIFIDRNVDDIISDVEIKTRPLLKDGTDKVYSLYKERYVLYRGYADSIVPNVGSLEDIASNIMNELERLMGAENLENHSD